MTDKYMSLDELFEWICESTRRESKMVAEMFADAMETLSSKDKMDECYRRVAKMISEDAELHSD